MLPDVRCEISGRREAVRQSPLLTGEAAADLSKRQACRESKGSRLVNEEEKKNHRTWLEKR